jgi:hypothetical protein
MGRIGLRPGEANASEQIDIDNRGEREETEMTKNRWAALIAGIFMVACSGVAAAADYTFHWVNNINYFTYSDNADAVCNTVKAKVMLSGNPLATAQFDSPLQAGQRRDMTVSAPACTNILLEATCTFKNKDKHQVTKSKSVSVMCWGGDAIVLPDPDTAPTGIDVVYYCTPPCK